MFNQVSVAITIAQGHFSLLHLLTRNIVNCNMWKWYDKCQKTDNINLNLCEFYIGFYCWYIPCEINKCSIKIKHQDEKGKREEKKRLKKHLLSIIPKLLLAHSHTNQTNAFHGFGTKHSVRLVSCLH